MLQETIDWVLGERHLGPACPVCGAGDGGSGECLGDTWRAYGTFAYSAPGALLDQRTPGHLCRLGHDPATCEVTVVGDATGDGDDSARPRSCAATE